MKTIKNFLIINLIILLSISCGIKETRKNIINEEVLISKLSKDSLYKEFFSFNIRPREQGRIYMIETELIKEFWIHYSEDVGVTLPTNEEAYLDMQLKKIYSENYLEQKETIIFQLNKLISFILNNGITSVVHVKNKRIDFDISNNYQISRFNKSFLSAAVENMKRFYDSVDVVDSNWVIFRKMNKSKQSK